MGCIFCTYFTFTLFSVVQTIYCVGGNQAHFSMRLIDSRWCFAGGCISHDGSSGHDGGPLEQARTPGPDGPDDCPPLTGNEPHLLLATSHALGYLGYPTNRLLQASISC